MSNLTSLVSHFKQTSAIALAFVSISAVFGTLLWFGNTKLQSRVCEAQADIGERINLIETTADLQITAKTLDEQVRSLQANIQSMRAKFPSTADESEFLQQLSETAEATGVYMSDFRPGGISSLSTCKMLELKIRGTAPYPSLCRWLAGLSHLPRVVQLSQLSVCGPVTPEGSCTIDIQLNLIFGIDLTKLPSSKVES